MQNCIPFGGFVFVCLLGHTAMKTSFCQTKSLNFNMANMYLKFKYFFNFMFRQNMLLSYLFNRLRFKLYFPYFTTSFKQFFAAICEASALKKWGYIFHKMSTALINFNKFSFHTHCYLFTFLVFMDGGPCIAGELLKIIRKSN